MTPRPAGADAIAPAEFAACFAGLGEAGAILAAVSGGPDSTALMLALALWTGERGGPAIQVATVDHGLRPASRAEAEAVGRQAAAIGLPHAVLTWTGRAPGPVSQERARDARYDLLVAHAAAIGASHLATAHTEDDQAETLLIRMAAGSGIAGLAGMASVTSRGDILHARPLLGFAKARLVATCRANGWAFVDDPSNRDTRFARTRWRSLAPALAEAGLDAPCLARLARRAARAEVALASLARAAFDRLADVGPGLTALDADRLAAEPDEIALRVLALALHAEGGPHPVRLDRLEACLAALTASRLAGRPVRRTLAGRLLSLGRDGCITVAPEPPRRRGRRSGETRPSRVRTARPDDHAAANDRPGA